MAAKRAFSLEFVSNVKVTMNPWFPGNTAAREFLNRLWSSPIADSNPVCKVVVDTVSTAEPLPARIDVAFEDGSSARIRGAKTTVRDIVNAFSQKQRQVSMKMMKK